MKVLVINGSPKGQSSNTMKLTRAFMNGADWSDVEIIDVIRSEIKPCLGCFACWRKTPGKCVINDDMNEILPKIIAADIIIWSFPLYYFSLPGMLKNLIDRQLPMLLPFMEEGNAGGGHSARYDISRQKHIVISTCGFWTAEGNYDGVLSTLDHWYGTRNYTVIFCGQGELFNIPELKNRTDAYLGIVRRAGAEIAVSERIEEKTAKELTEPLYPRDVFEKMADASWGIAKSESSGEKPDDSLAFTKQMAALYRPDGKERVLEFHYTDINKTYQIWLTKQGSELVTDGFKQHTTRIETPYFIWQSIARGEISGQDALFQRQYKVLGDFELMLKWGELFGTAKKPSVEKVHRKSSMTVFLAPWIIIWIAMAINPTAGSVAGIIAAVSVQLLWSRFRPVIFEQISISVVTGLSLAVLLGADTQFVVPASYLIFGLLWLISVFFKTPLSAYYSAANYGDESAFTNPLFIRTNRLLTTSWGVLYLITAIWTYILMGTSLSAYTGLINSACPALLGIFTAWFQKWYPARWARG